MTQSNQTFELIVDSASHGKRIDQFLTRHFRNYSPQRMLRLASFGCIEVNGLRATSTQIVYQHQRVTVRLLDPPDKLYDPEPIDFEIIFEDPWLIVINKPVGLVAHPVGQFDAGTLANAVQHHLDQTGVARGLIRPGIVHRLDRETSGVIVMTKEHTAHRGLMSQFEHHQTSKSYLALVEGIVCEDEQFIDKPIGRLADWTCPLMSAQSDARQAKSAYTYVSVIRRFAKHTLVEASLFTGRQHQIRVHLASIGHPLVDDPDYAAHGKIKSESDEARRINRVGLLGRQALHAWRITFNHPIDGRMLWFEAAMPTDFVNAIDTIGRV